MPLRHGGGLDPRCMRQPRPRTALAQSRLLWRPAATAFGSQRVAPRATGAMEQGVTTALGGEVGTAGESPPRLAPLPDPAGCWALVTGATSGLGRALAQACVRGGFGVVLEAQSSVSAELEVLALELSEGGRARVVAVPVDLEDPAAGAELLHQILRERGYDVALLLVASDQFGYTGSFLQQPPSNLDRMLALNVGATSALCRLFGADMAAAGRGRILLVGAPAGASPGTPGACAFASSMAFIRALADGLRQELASTGVGVSCLESRGLGREGSLEEGLANTCVSFLGSEEKAAASNGGRRLDASGLGPSWEPVRPSAGPAAAAAAVAVAAAAASKSTAFSASSRSSSGPGVASGGTAESASLADPDDFATRSQDAWAEAYGQLARERGFQVLPFGAEIDRLQRSSPAEFSNALLVGFVCVIFALQTLPDISPQTRGALIAIEDIANALFFLDYLARWWSRGLRWDYLLTSAMIFDLVSVLPFLLRPFVPVMGGIEFDFLKLLRVLRVYRFFRPNAFQSIVRIFLPPEMADQADLVMAGVQESQLQVVRTFGVLFTLIFITAGLVYEAEHSTNPQFKDFFSSLYFSIIALSTVGFGDYAPITPAGKTVVSISIIVGLCIVPYQASLVASAVADEQRRRDEKPVVLDGSDAEAILASLEESRAQLAWDAARIAELEDLEREERARIADLEEQAREREGAP